jgi:hypothetical protein
MKPDNINGMDPEVWEVYRKAKFTTVSNPLENIEVPETWNDVEEFGRWWVGAGLPLLYPEKPEVFRTDDATAISIFRKGRFQVELYLIHPRPKLPDHEHPGVEVIKMRMGHTGDLTFSNVLTDGNSHGAGIRLEAEVLGFPLIAIQHWKTRDPITVAAMWKGKTVGPLQEELIKRFHPDAYVVDGYADITRKMTDV